MPLRGVALTGAGISAESGVSPFRGGGGMGPQGRPEGEISLAAPLLATPEAFARDPVRGWEWYAWRREIIARAVPNPAHRTLAEGVGRLPRHPGPPGSLARGARLAVEVVTGRLPVSHFWGSDWICPDGGLEGAAGMGPMGSLSLPRSPGLRWGCGGTWAFRGIHIPAGGDAATTTSPGPSSVAWSEVRVGDRVEIYGRDRRAVYVVIERHILPERSQPLAVRRANARWIGTTAEPRLTLVSCWPPWSNSHRLIVIARPAEAMGTASPVGGVRAPEPVAWPPRAME